MSNRPFEYHPASGNQDALAIASGVLFEEGWTHESSGRGEERTPKSGPRFGSTTRHQHRARAASGSTVKVMRKLAKARI
ncbi:hypothetical protein [Roseinatronobacter sp. S2]|uniref:hypothetical protein n=1 Tax=Roseinatronobacter sp. S2 TaxID=3035471 RepID=UPI0024103CA6|nr:hypothetical protein [Roseinatronobacter sp. S2]WFE74757.1 hypothetical protein P8S53_16435 [Roseinatronobacter sp. S2]